VPSSGVDVIERGAGVAELQRRVLLLDLLLLLLLLLPLDLSLDLVAAAGGENPKGARFS
jgi:hypothetical protein